MATEERGDSLKWLAALATMAPLLAVARSKKGIPLNPEQINTVLQDIRGAMNMLLRGNAPMKHPDPRIVKQFESLGQRTEDINFPAFFDAAVARYQDQVPYPVLPRERNSRMLGDLVVKTSPAGSQFPTSVFPGVSLKSEWWDPAFLSEHAVEGEKHSVFGGDPWERLMAKMDQAKRRETWP